jgi:hypothetical protein
MDLNDEYKVILPSPKDLMATAEQFLREGNETTEADILAKCSLEIGDLVCIRGYAKEVNFTLRCPRSLLDHLKPINAGSCLEEPAEAMKRIQEALALSLPSGYAIASLQARAALVRSITPEEEEAEIRQKYDEEVKRQELKAIENKDFENFSSVKNLKANGRPWIENLLKNLYQCPLPPHTLTDDELAETLSQSLRSLDDSPGGARSQILHVIKFRKDEQAEELRKFKDKYFTIKVIRCTTGKALLNAVTTADAQQQDYPEELTQDQREMVQTLLETIHDYMNIHTVMEIGWQMQSEQEVAQYLTELSKLGLAVFVGSYRMRSAFEGNSGLLARVAVVMIRPANDPRIKNDGSDTDYIMAAFERTSPQAKPDKHPPAHLPPPKKQDVSTPLSQPARTPPTNQSQYHLQKTLGVWNIIFNGINLPPIPESRGMNLIANLLGDPPEVPIHATVLENRVDGSPVVEGLDNPVGGVIQEASGAKLTGPQGEILKRELAELRQTRDDTALPQTERDEADARIKELLRADSKAGKFAGAAEHSVDRVRKAISGTIKKLKESDHTACKDFGSHLEKHIWIPSMGLRGRVGASGSPGCFTYEPPDEIVWTQ